MTSTTWAKYLAELDEAWLGNCVNYAMSALSIYEFLINIDLEVSTAWKRKKTAPSLLLLTIRWCMLANGVLIFAPTPSFNVRIALLCKASAILGAMFNLAGFAQAALVSALRVFALADNSLVLSVVVLVLSLMPIGTNAYRDSNYVCELSGGSYSVSVPVSSSLYTTDYSDKMRTNSCGCHRPRRDVEEDLPPVAHQQSAPHESASHNVSDERWNHLFPDFVSDEHHRSRRCADLGVANPRTEPDYRLSPAHFDFPLPPEPARLHQRQRLRRGRQPATAFRPRICSAGRVW
ncbi:hypothetical protein PsYK624_145100 [Phanerochaete sordida]|uniref:DUF6533 domain-containing protein n=1 Tax=Phanerochaete sordida TaxID=48140 RepID=A0A9P3GRX3_9APHY|nr:hypothetical protein PsYK624_145100 [Phanerochaete sordida]